MSGFTHPNFGKQVRIEVYGREVRLIFTTTNAQRADDFADDLLRQLKDGALNITLMGKPTSITEETP